MRDRTVWCGCCVLVPNFDSNTGSRLSIRWAGRFVRRLGETVEAGRSLPDYRSAVRGAGGGFREWAGVCVGRQSVGGGVWPGASAGTVVARQGGDEWGAGGAAAAQRRQWCGTEGDEGTEGGEEDVTVGESNKMRCFCLICKIYKSKDIKNVFFFIFFNKLNIILGANVGIAESMHYSFGDPFSPTTSYQQVDSSVATSCKPDGETNTKSPCILLKTIHKMI